MKKTKVTLIITSTLMFFFSMNLFAFNDEDVTRLLNEKECQGGLMADCDLSDWKDNQRKTLDLSNAKLSQANMAGADLTDIILSGSEMDSLNLSGAKLTRIDFTGCDLRDANFSNTTMYFVDFSNARLEGAKFEGAKMKGVSFHKAQLDEDIPFERLDTQTVDFSAAKGIGSSPCSGPEFSTCKK